MGAGIGNAAPNNFLIAGPIVVCVVALLGIKPADAIHMIAAFAAIQLMHSAGRYPAWQNRAILARAIAISSRA